MRLTFNETWLYVVQLLLVACAVATAIGVVLISQKVGSLARRKSSVGGMIKVLLYDENNVLIRNLGLLPEVPNLREEINIVDGGKYTSRWLVLQRIWSFDPNGKRGVVSLAVTKLSTKQPNTIDVDL